jgi:hypothetical protein
MYKIISSVELFGFTIWIMSAPDERNVWRNYLTFTDFGNAV